MVIDVATMSYVAIVQAGSILYDTVATLDKLENLTKEAATNGAKLIVFPEAFVGGYPKGLDFGIVTGTRSSEGREEFRRYYDSAIEEHGSESKRISEIAAIYDVFIVVGVVERHGDTVSKIDNRFFLLVFFYAPNGYLGKHRKLMPTAMERCIWGNGDGSTMPVYNTAVGKIGAAICWENYMPMYRMTLYNKGIELYLACTVDDRETWLPTMRMIALEGRCYVISSAQFLTSSAYPEDHPMRMKHGQDKVSKITHSISYIMFPILIRGGSCAIDPLGNVLVQPDFTKELIHYVHVDLSRIACAKMDMDTVGHYSRPEVFQLIVNEKPFLPVVEQ
ncbi:hydrolase, carbon-nitrogen family [Dictyocaulus viviparus]|uniref:Hydrolase, carbon-nitrogen family n=1 Tax=Dictyocaulus viviparus TaxID=29172 RepID=A0A0D8Y7P6_DICVI|nr:hydrolase, carbon-nitrogen family [Dictyocaulus viviparus]